MSPQMNNQPHYTANLNTSHSPAGRGQPSPYTQGQASPVPPLRAGPQHTNGPSTITSLSLAKSATQTNQYDHTHYAPLKAGEGYTAGAVTEDTRPQTGIVFVEHLGTLAPHTITYRPLPRPQNSVTPNGKIPTTSLLS